MDVDKWAPVQGAKSDNSKPLHGTSDLESERIDKKDYYDAPVLWIKKIFGCSKEKLIEKTEEAFKNADMPEVKVVELYATSNRNKDHAYMLLNSNRATNLLLDGSIDIIITVQKNDKDSGDEDRHLDVGEKDNEMDITLWFAVADHLKPSDRQEACTIFIQGLPDNRPSVQIAQELRRRISKWCPIEDINVPSDKAGKGLSVGNAKVTFQCEFDTQKCLYLLNYSIFLDKEIKASFCNTDRTYIKRSNYSSGRGSRKGYSNDTSNRDNRNNRDNIKEPSTKELARSPPKETILIKRYEEEQQKPASKSNNDGWTEVKSNKKK